MKILYFAWVREQIGIGEENVDPPAAIQDIAGLIGWLAQRSRGHDAALSDPSRLRAAIDNRFAGPNDSIFEAREVAIFPPVTGG